MMNLWASLPASIRGFIRGIGIAVVFSVLDYISANLGTSGIVSPAIAGIITALIAGFENHKTAIAQSRLQ